MMIHSFIHFPPFNSKKDLVGVSIAPTVRLFNGQISNLTLRYVNTSTERNVLLLIASKVQKPTCSPVSSTGSAEDCSRISVAGHYVPPVAICALLIIDIII